MIWGCLDAGIQTISLGNWLSPTLNSDFLIFALSSLFCFGGGKGAGSPIHILKALSLISCDWIDLGHTFIPEQVWVQGLEYIDEADLPGPSTSGSWANPTQTT